MAIDLHGVRSAFLETILGLPGMRGPASRRFARLMARATYPCKALFKNPAEVRQAFGELFPNLGPAEIERLSQRWWVCYIQSRIDRRALEGLSSGELLRYCTSRVDVAGAERLAAISETRGPAIVLWPHFGNYSLAGLRLALEATRGRAVHLFYSETDAYGRVFEGLLRKLGRPAFHLPTTPTGTRRALRLLRSGEWIVSLPDIVTNPASAVYVPFFGRLVQAMTGTAFLAVKSGARVLPMYCRRTEGERFLLRFDPEVPIPDTSRFEEDVYEGTARIYRSMEMQFRRFPEHWWQWNRLTQRLARGVEPVTDPTAARRQLRDLIPRVGFDNAALSEVLRDLYARLPAVRDEVRLPDPTGANRDGSPGLAPYA